MEKIEIQKEEDRIIVAGILIKNGYCVAQMHEKKSGKNFYSHYLVYEKANGLKDGGSMDDG